MNTTFKNIAIRTLAATALVAGAMSTANAGIFIRTGFFVTPVAVVAPVAVAPVVATPVAVAPVAIAPVVQVYVPTCRFVSIPVVNPYTGWTFLATRRVCN